MKYYNGAAVLKFTWDQVATAFWSRYPNPNSGHVLSEDTLQRKMSQGKLISHRILTKCSKAPKWGERFVPGPSFVCVVEESIVDPKEKTLTTYTRNVGYTKVMKVEEKCVYKPNPENKEWTVCERQAWISSDVLGFGFAIQRFGIERFKKQAHKTVSGFEHVLKKMYMPESIPELPKPIISPGKLKATAQKAKELAKTKAGPVIASCTGGTATG